MTLFNWSSQTSSNISWFITTTSWSNAVFKLRITYQVAVICCNRPCDVVVAMTGRCWTLAVLAGHEWPLAFAGWPRPGMAKQRLAMASLFLLLTSARLHVITIWLVLNKPVHANTCPYLSRNKIGSAGPFHSEFRVSCSTIAAYLTTSQHA